MTNYVEAYQDETHIYHREAIKLAGQFFTDTDNDVETGIVRWKSNGRVPPKDVVALWDHLQCTVDVDACDAAREEETKAFLKRYRESQPAEPTDEERFEARAAHGPGVELVDVFSGRRFTT